MKCPVCGETYGVTHACRGPRGVSPSVAEAWPVPSGFAPLRYFRQALAIARLNDDAVVAASLDSKSLAYGAAFWLIGQCLILGHVILGLSFYPRTIHWLAFLAGSVVLIVIGAAWLLAQYGVCHLLARWWFDARGTYLGVLRPLLLGSIVAWLLIIPYIGQLAGELWAIAVMMIVFENVDGIERIKAFALSFGVGVVFLVLTRSLLSLR